MKRTFSAGVWREGDRWVAQCRELDVAGGGRSEGEAPANPREAVGLLLSLPGAETGCRPIAGRRNKNETKPVTEAPSLAATAGARCANAVSVYMRDRTTGPASWRSGRRDDRTMRASPRVHRNPRGATGRIPLHRQDSTLP